MEKTILNEDTARIILGSSVMATFLISCILSFFYSAPTLVAQLLAQLVMLVMGFYFGSSQGSKTKETMLKELNGKH